MVFLYFRKKYIRDLLFCFLEKTIKKYIGDGIQASPYGKVASFGVKCYDIVGEKCDSCCSPTCNESFYV